MARDHMDNPSGCVCYIVNNGYLLPALVSASQARRHTPKSVADIVIVIVDRPHAEAAAFGEAAKSLSVEILYAQASDINNMHIMFARLFLDRLLSERYTRIVYIDGDTQVDGDLTPLFEVRVEDGHFLACRDPAHMFAQLSSTWRRRIDAERAAIDYQGPSDRYFNSGVLVVDRSSWPELARKCLDLADRRGQTMKFPDQDILNLAIGDRCRLISHRWNFPGFLIGSAAETKVQPRIYHFMSNPRPWIVAAPPWGTQRLRPYQDLLAQHPALAFLKPAGSIASVVRAHLAQTLKMALEYNRVGAYSETAPDIAD